jgi:hypothetical protein
MPSKMKYSNKRQNYKRKNKRRGARGKAVKKYAPAQKSNIVKSLMPIAESRKYQVRSPTGENLQDMWRTIIPNVWERMMREGEAQTFDTQAISSAFSGNTLFSRYINFESQIEFDTIRHIQEPVQLLVIQGWWKTPYLTEAQSAGDGLADRNTNGVLLGYNPENYINRQLQVMLSDRFDTIDKKKCKIKFMKEYNITGKAIQVENSIGLIPGADPEVKRECVRTRLRHNFSWKPQRKLHMTPATIYKATDTPNPVYFKPDDTNCFWTPSAQKNEELWIPFVAYKFKNYTAFGVDEEAAVDANSNPKLYVKQTHYFLDM